MKITLTIKNIYSFRQLLYIDTCIR